MKPVRFVGTAGDDLAAFPDPARRAAGYELFTVQVGREPSDFKPLPDVIESCVQLLTAPTPSEALALVR